MLALLDHVLDKIDSAQTVFCQVLTHTHIQLVTELVSAQTDRLYKVGRVIVISIQRQHHVLVSTDIVMQIQDL
jgi:hypothetical protein